MPLAFALGSLGRDALKAAAGLALLLLLAVVCLLSLLAGLANPFSAGVPTGLAAAPITNATKGGAVAPPSMGDTRWGYGLNTYCEVYVEQRVGWGNQGVTAYAAYQRLAGLGLVHAGPPDTPGEVVYFGPSSDNEGAGHVGVYDGDGRFTSITYYGLQQEPMADWHAPYLGWVQPSDVTSDRFGNPVSPKG
jgi:hypothetical protein